MADAHGSGPCVRKDVRVQLPPRPPCSEARPLARPGLFPFSSSLPGGRAPRTPHGAVPPDPAWLRLWWGFFGGECHPVGSAWCSLLAEFLCFQDVVFLIHSART